MDYTEFKVFMLYCINKIDYNVFRELLNTVLNTVITDSYLNEKWAMYKRAPLEFIFQFDDDSMFNLIRTRIAEEKYKG